MTFIVKLFYVISASIIVWAMIGYPVLLLILEKIYSSKENNKDYSLVPSVTIMIVAHNEEKVIHDKLKNVAAVNYPKNKIKILVASDNSTDNTNKIVEQFIRDFPEIDIELYKTKKRMGKTNAQNEAQKIVTTEYLIMTDANAMLDNNSVRELIASFTSADICYVTGRLSYTNSDNHAVSSSEQDYWDIDLKMRDIESRIQTITAGNGALYACRNSQYVDFDHIESHDSAMPLYFALNKKRAIMNKDALAFEKAGETISDEFNRKVRMNRVLLKHILPNVKILNIFKYKWFTIFYLGHRTSRYLLWLAHLSLFISNLLLVQSGVFFILTLLCQIIAIGTLIIYPVLKSKSKILRLIYYYMITILAQFVGVFKTITGQSKPFWEKAESTR